MGDILEGIEVLFLGGDFNGAAPAAGTIEIQGVWIRSLGPINGELVVVEAFVQRARSADPSAVLALGEGDSSTQVATDALGFGRDDANSGAAFGVDLGVLPPRLIG